MRKKSQKTRQLYEVKDVEVDQSVEILPQWTHVLDHLGVHLKYITTLFVNHTPVKLGGGRN